jgi:AcrR family transcriptional regulator
MGTHDDWHAPQLMARPALHDADGILDAARDLVLLDGARAATIDRLVAASGVPKGSIYHRFATLDDVLAGAWLRAARRSQERFLQALESDVGPRAAVAAGLAIHDFAASDAADARLLAAVRRADLASAPTSPEVTGDLRTVNDRLAAPLLALTRQLCGRATRSAVEWTMCAVIDLPHGAVRRHLVDGTPLPLSLRPQLEAAIRGAIARPDTTTKEPAT